MVCCTNHPGGWAAEYKISSRNGLGVNPVQSYSTWVRQIAVGAFSVFVFPLAVDFLKRMAENAGIYDRPGEAAGTVLNFFLSLSQQTWLRVTALTLGAFPYRKVFSTSSMSNNVPEWSIMIRVG